jgi:glutamate-ammonia-ligase adenylyltransferase
MSEPRKALPLWQQLSRYPCVADHEKAEMRVAALLQTGPEALRSLGAQPQVGRLLLGLCDHSPYLWRLASMDVERLTRLLSTAPDESRYTALTNLESETAAMTAEAPVMRRLRLAKQEIALLVALADLGGAWDLIAVMQALSDAADVFVRIALRFVVRHLSQTGKLLIDDNAFEQHCGLAIIALGKLGAVELNYSSDIDLMVVFDPDSYAIPAGIEPGPLYVRITKSLVRLLQERTADGYVARVDLRLRPDPGSTAIAIGLPSALSYYENYGQNWERAALIKARPIAGDLALGERFREGLVPFIWRKYFDYAAIADIQAMKRQTHALRGHDEIAVEGHDVKLGRGGIREIEFFVQTQQLIFGGKHEALRGARTLDMLEQLCEDHWITREAADDLRLAYVHLRNIEHRLQMINDEQTHRLPHGQEALERFASFCGSAHFDDFHRSLSHDLQRVVFHYALLFEHAPDLSAEMGSLVFVGVTDDPETLQTLSKFGFKDPKLAIETIRGWHFGRRLAVRTTRAREVLTELVPHLIKTFSDTGSPDAALAAFDNTLANMPSAIELFLILKSNPKLRDLFSDIMGTAPRLARVIEQRPHVLDAVLDVRQLHAALDEAAFKKRLDSVLAAKAQTEAFLDALRDFYQEEVFLISLRLLLDVIDASMASRAFSDLAAAIIQAALHFVEAQIERDHGTVSGGRCILVALGRLGAYEMTAVSDLDLMLVYEFDTENPTSNGRRPLHAIQYYTRIAQRLVSTLTVQTRRGGLYEVDLRLRPSGRKGPVAVQMSGFFVYQTQEAETWEHMALTRAWVVAGDSDLAARFHQTVRRIIALPRGRNLQKDVVAMRNLIAREKVETGPWNLKLTAGGFLDIEFLMQYILLRYSHQEPNFYAVSTARLIEQAASFHFLSQDDAHDLLAAHRLFTRVHQVQRITLGAETPPSSATSTVQRRLAAAAGLPDFQHLVSELDQTRARVRHIFTRVLTKE